MLPTMSICLEPIKLAYGLFSLSNPPECNSDIVAYNELVYMWMVSYGFYTDD